MPPASSNNKLTRSSIYGWAKKRSVSPSAPQSSNSKAKPTAVAAPAPIASSSTSAMNAAGSSSAPSVPVRRPEESPYFEDDYADEIQAYMHSMDNNTVASAELMDMQPELQWFMRPYLIDFLVEVHQQFRLRPEVLYLSMNIVDRYVSKRVVYKKHYQLVGCAALWIAAKFEDGKDKVPLVRELADMCCKAYDESAFIQMEGHVLSTIGWTIGHPTAEAWLRINTCGRKHEDPKIQNIARFLMEITLFHREFVGIQSSLIAQGALMLARFICGKPRKPVARYENIAVRIAQAIDKHFADKLEQVSEIVIRKYAPTYYGRASTICREWYLSGRRFHYQPEAPATPVSAGLPTPGLAPSSSWPNKRGSWVSASPSAGSMSCASSDAGDESPLTPITPVHTHVDPFSVASKENMPPSTSSSSMASVGSTSSVSSYVGIQPKDVNMASVPAVPQMGKVPVASLPGNHAHAGQMSGIPTQQRPVLHALPGDLALPNRSMRRLSN